MTGEEFAKLVILQLLKSGIYGKLRNASALGKSDLAVLS